MQINLAYALSTAIALLLGLTIHEFAHAWSAYRLGDYTPYRAGRVTLNPLAHLDPTGTILMVLTIFGMAPIAWGKPVPINPYNMRHPRRDTIITSAAGPFSNLALALGVALLWRIIHSLTGATLAPNSGAYTLMVILIYFNVALMVFNLLPLPPLDGFHVLENLAPREWAPLINFLHQYGMWILFGLLMVGWLLPFSPLWLIIGPPINALSDLLLNLAGL
ncbi:MAG: site-2 protease family protein [Chloroflexia bacterium]|nr:site-2 protease family protein [Chloroflexia bacterium]